MSNSRVSQPVPPQRGRRIVIAIAIGLVAVPFLWTWVPAEVGRWHLGAAEEKLLDHDNEAALAAVDRAIRWNPANADFYAYRSGINLKLKRLDDALSDANRSLELSPTNNLYGLQQRVLVQQRRGDHDAALSDANAIVELASDNAVSPRTQTSYANALNLRAYAHALANSGIESGLEDIDNAIARTGTDNHAYIDTRGYLRYLAGDDDGALEDMERAVELAEAGWEAFAEMPKTGDERDWRAMEQVWQEDLAVLYHHRGLVYNRLGQSELGASDLKRAADYGYSPENGVW